MIRFNCVIVSLAEANVEQLSDYDTAILQITYPDIINEAHKHCKCVSLQLSKLSLLQGAHFAGIDTEGVRFQAKLFQPVMRLDMYSAEDSLQSLTYT